MAGDKFLLLLAKQKKRKRGAGRKMICEYKGNAVVERILS